MMELRGLPVANALTEAFKLRINQLKLGGITPKLSVIRIGNKEEDISYERSIIKKFSSLDAVAEVTGLPYDVTQETVEAVIKEMNNDNNVHGILLFRPLPEHLSYEKIKSVINADKDVDCMSQTNTARLFSGEKNGYPPCTAQAVMEILDYYKVDLAGKKAVIVGRSLVVGKPLGMLLLEKNATVTICHSKTKNLPEECRRADILIACAGSANMITREFTNPSQIIIDVGINVEEGRLCGDVKYGDVAEYVQAITPVPGGVGTVTTIELLKHTIISAERYNAVVSI